MKKQTMRLLLLLLVVAMLTSTMSITALAVDEQSALVRLEAEPGTVTTGAQAVIHVIAEQADVITDGKLTVSYDADVLAYQRAEAAAGWPEAVVLSANANTAGTVILTFSGDEATKAEVFIDLYFTAKAEGTTTVGIDGSKSYLTGVQDSLNAQTAVTVTAGSGETPTQQYLVSFSAGAHGKLTNAADATRMVNAGEAIGAVPALTIDSGYSLSGWMLDATDETYTSSQVAEMKVESELSFTAVYTSEPVIEIPTQPVVPSGTTDNGQCDGGINCPSYQYKDVNFTGDYHAGIDYMVANGYMNGTSSDTFSPDLSMNRAMMVTILYRLAGSPAVSGTNPFTDVKQDNYFYNAVIWAYTNGVTTGTSSDTFSPDALLTREQIATFLYRYAQFTGTANSVRGSLSSYTDAGSVSNYALIAMQWAVGNGIINGTSSTKLTPTANATRVQIAVMVWRFMR